MEDRFPDLDPLFEVPLYESISCAKHRERQWQQLEVVHGMSQEHSDLPTVGRAKLLKTSKGFEKSPSPSRL